MEQININHSNYIKIIKKIRQVPDGSRLPPSSKFIVGSVNAGGSWATVLVVFWGFVVSMVYFKTCTRIGLTTSETLLDLVACRLRLTKV